MLYHHDSNKARDFSRSALDLMQQYDVPQVPHNNVVWYTYVSGANMDLKKTIDVLTSNSTKFESKICEELYERFFTSTGSEQKIQSTTEKASQILTTLISSIQKMGTDTSSFSDTLDSASKGLKDVSNTEDLSKMIQTLAQASDTMMEQNRALETKLQKSKETIDTLNRDLDSLNREVLRDGLTGIANRRAFDVSIRQFMAECMEKGSDLNLMMIDIDFFKKFNDSFGHQVGDQVIKLLARTLTDCVRDLGLPARYGGEEFAVLLTKANRHKAEEIATLIRETMASRSIKNRTTGESLGKITVSIGLTDYRMGESSSELIERADQALYKAKHTGRNKVISSF